MTQAGQQRLAPPPPAIRTVQAGQPVLEGIRASQALHHREPGGIAGPPSARTAASLISTHRTVGEETMTSTATIRHPT